MTLTRRAAFLLAALGYCRACDRPDRPASQRLDDSAEAHAVLMATWRALPAADRALAPDDIPAEPREAPDDDPQPDYWWKEGQYE